METLYNHLFTDMATVVICYSILLLACASNIVLSIFYNISMKSERFNKSRLMHGLKKISVLIIGTLLLVAAVDVATILLAKYVPDINEQVHDFITVSMIAATIGVAAWRYIRDAYDTFINIINGKPSGALEALENKD